MGDGLIARSLLTQDNTNIEENQNLLMYLFGSQLQTTCHKDGTISDANDEPELEMVLPPTDRKFNVAEFLFLGVLSYSEKIE
jgi:hypothetical protein